MRTQEIPEQLRNNEIVYRFCYAEDHCNWDLLADDKLEECLNFIYDSIKNGGNVLVHWCVFIIENIFHFFYYGKRNKIQI